LDFFLGKTTIYDTLRRKKNLREEGKPPALCHVSAKSQNVSTYRKEASVLKTLHCLGRGSEEGVFSIKKGGASTITPSKGGHAAAIGKFPLSKTEIEESVQTGGKQRRKGGVPANEPHPGATSRNVGATT